MRHCLEPRCPTLVESGRCAQHARQRWSSTTGQPPRIAGNKLQRLRKWLWQQDPRCRQCRRVLVLDEAIRDHIVNIREGGSEIPENTQILCARCHDSKTQTEQQRGRSRAV